MMTAIPGQNSRTVTTSAVVVHIRPNRKCFSFNGSLFALLMVILCAQQAACRPGQNEELLPRHFNVDEEFRDVDNLEIHRVKFVNGMMKADHPIVMYKEDFVDENYVPSMNETKTLRKYKDITHRRRHKATTPKPDYTENIEEFKEAETEKIYFDFVPETPIIVPDDSDKSKKSHIKLVPLSQELKNDDMPSKDDLLKIPKKYHRRVRRDASDESHVVHKRNPFYRQVPHNSNTVQGTSQTVYVFFKHAVPGKKHNGLDIPVTKRPKQEQNANTPQSFDNRIAADENDRVIFSSGPRTTVRPGRRPSDDSIFRDPRPENYDFSFMNQGQPQTSTVAPLFNRRPATRAPESIFRDPSPENYDFSFMNQGQSNSGSSFAPATTSRPTSAPSTGSQTPSQTAQSTPISQCVWAIVNCCSNSDTEIRYSCFEQNGCFGAFWGLNPCAENVRDNFVNLVADYYN